MRQKLKLKNFNDIRGVLNKLEPGQVETTGLWSYYQILTHCATAMENSILGRRREMSWWKRHVKGPLFFWKISRDGCLPSGIKGNPQIAFDERIEGDEKATLARLLKTMEDFERFEGNLSDHILLGNLSRKQWMLFHSCTWPTIWATQNPKKTTNWFSVLKFATVPGGQKCPGAAGASSE